MPRPQLQPRIPRTTNNAHEEPSWLASSHIDRSCALFAGGNGSPMSKADRTAMLTAVRAGDVAELELEAVTFIQRDTPNRNYVRFKPGMLAGFAKSFEGQPVLKDHDSSSLSSRAGTIVASKLEHNEDGSKSIRMRMRLVKDWAVEAALDGTLDRFSIGWNRTAPSQCSICEASLRDCQHWPGEADAKTGAVCELLFTGADGTEVSGVNVPAVVGTRIESISQLQVVDPLQLACILGEDTTGSAQADPHGEMTMLKLAQIAATLGLTASATEDEVLAAADAHAKKLKIAEEANAGTAARLAAIEADNKRRADEERVAVVNAGINKLIAAGKLLPADAVEEAKLRGFAAQSLEVFQYAVDTKLAGANVSPVGAPLAALKSDPAGDRPVMTALAEVASDNAQIPTWLKRLGLSKEDEEKYSASGIAQLKARRASGY